MGDIYEYKVIDGGIVLTRGVQFAVTANGTKMIWDNGDYMIWRAKGGMAWAGRGSTAYYESTYYVVRRMPGGTKQSGHVQIISRHEPGRKWRAFLRDKINEIGA